MPQIQFKGIRFAVIASRFPGTCSLTGEKFGSGDEIAYTRSSDLSEVQTLEIFGTRRVTPSVTIKMPLPNDKEAVADAYNERPAYRPKAKDDAAPLKPYVPFTPNVQQIDIKQELVTTQNHILIKALAGTGKTSTLVWLVRSGTEDHTLKGKVIYLAFNKSIQEELAEKMQGTGVPALTTHSFGYSALRKHFGKNIDIPGTKNGVIKDKFMELLCRENGFAVTEESIRQVRKTEEYQFRAAVIELIGYIKNWAIFPHVVKDHWEFTADQQLRFAELIAIYEIEMPPNGTPQQIMQWATRTLLANMPLPGERLNKIDYDDMLYLPLALNLPFEGYDLVLTDESQDFNTCQHLMLERILKVRNGRAIVVGDPNQSLYGFRGADPRSFDRIADLLKATGRPVTVLPLPVNYRCDADIIEYAQQWVPEIEGASKVPGTVDEIGFYESIERANNEGFDIELADGPDHATRALPLPGKPPTRFAFLCRINLPLIVTAYQLIAREKRVCIIGRNQIGAPLKHLVEALCGNNSRSPDYTNRLTDLTDRQGRIAEKGLLSRLNDYVRIQSAKLAEERHENKLEALIQNVECLEVVCQQVKDNQVSSVIAQIDKLFVEEAEPGAISLSTIHRAKGLEFDVVLILCPNLLPHPSAKTDDERQQERNACYVACTRARYRLYYVSDWPFGSKKGQAKAETYEFKKPEPRVALKPPVPEVPVIQPSVVQSSVEVEDDGLPF